MKFTALDFEKANNEKTSVCSIGLSTFEDGVEVGHFYTLIKPFPFEFNYFCSQVHGISMYDVCEAPSFEEIYPLIYPFLNGNLVCHNYGADISSLRSLVSILPIDTPTPNIFCTLKLSRKLLKLQNYKLASVANHFKLGDFKQHNALDDARVCAEIFSRLYEINPEYVLNSAAEF